MGLFSLLAQDSPIAAQNSLSLFFPADNLDGDSVPHSHGTHKILDFGYLAPHECVRSRTPTAYRELLCNYKNAGGSHYGTTKKGRKHLVCEQTKKQRPDIILHDSGVLVAQTIYGFDSSVMKKIEKFIREKKPELLHHQKFLENGTAERAKESGTEQNYNMIDGCVNNNPKKPRIIGNRISVLDRLHIKLEERKQKSQPQQQQQQERSRKN